MLAGGSNENMSLFFNKNKRRLMKSSKKCPKTPISILQAPPRNLLVPTTSPSSEYELFQVSGKKICIEAYRNYVSKTKLFQNLEIYQWRNETEFPIARTKFVTIQQNQQQLIELIVYNEHCPIKLSKIPPMTLAQTIYMLKESLVGFQRLFTKFGPFEVKQAMVAVNQKGFCRVWINENFAINSVATPMEGEARMVQSIYDAISKHCQQSRSSKKLFSKLYTVSTFLSALKQLDVFVTEAKVLVAGRYVVTPASTKEIPENDARSNSIKNGSISQQSIRFSAVSKTPQPSKGTQWMNQENVEATDSISNVGNQIKRFKSVDMLQKGNNMKISDGETAYTRNNRDAKTTSQRDQFNSRFIEEQTKKPTRKWLEDSCFVMELDDEVKTYGKDKKEMSYSTNNLLKQQEHELFNNTSPRKFSANISLNRIGNFFSNHLFQKQSNLISQAPKQGTYNNYTQEFNAVIDNCKEQQQEIEKTPRRVTQREKQRISEEEVNKSQIQHTDTIMKTNGWNPIAGFFVPKELKESFHEGHEENKVVNELKLHKLESIGKRVIAMSLIPDDYEDII